MRTIYKYPISANDITSIKMPAGAHVLTVQNQREQPYIWAWVDTEEMTVKRHFVLVGTGFPIEQEWSELEFIGSFFLDGGTYVFHLFEVIAQ